jgi:hydrophobic/amphiphilic exporter-1 (mainly G- bacteria), HAE1 family
LNEKPVDSHSSGKDLRTSFFSFTTTRPVAITMVVIAVAVFGLVSYQRLSLNLMPDISYPTLTVRTAYPGTAPEEVENVISRPIEQALGIVSGLVSISSISKAGVSDVILEFNWDTDIDDAISQIREKIDRLYFPQEIERPLILRYDPTLDPIIRVAIHGSDDLFLMRWLSEEVVERELEKISGVAAVRVIGGLEEEVIVELDEGKLTTMNIGLSQVSARLAAENINMAGGRLREGDTEYMIRTLNEFRSLEEINDVVIESRGNALVRVSDLGRVYRGHKEREVITRVGGTQSVEIEIYKEADANVVAVAEEISRRLYGTPRQLKFLEQLKKQQEKESSEEGEKKEDKKQNRTQMKTMTDFISYDLPEGIEIRTLFDQSIFIRNSIDEVRNTAILGGILAIIILFVFLRSLPSTLIVSLAIPVSIIATFAPMYMFGVSLNIMSLGGLALGVGMLVDSSIVVLESIFRCRSEGDDTAHAAIRGTGEVGGAVLASTLTTIAVFLPIVFVEGIAGQIFGDMSLTVVFSLLASLLVALFVIPMLASRSIDAGPTTRRISTMLSPSIGSNLAEFQSRINSARGSGAKAKVASGGWLKILVLEIWTLLFKLVFVLFALLVAVIKGLMLIIADLPLWLAGFFLKKTAGRFAAFSAHTTFFGRNIFDRLWPGMASFHSPQKALDSQRALMDFLFRGKAVLRVLKWLLIFLPALIYFLIRLLIGLFMEILAKLLMAVGLILGMAVSGVLSLIVVLLAPLFLPLVALFNLVYSRIESFYPRIINWALGNRFKVAAGSLALFLFCWYVLIPDLGRELIPEVHQGEFDVQVRLPVGTPLSRTDEYLTAVEKIVGEDPEVADVSTIVGVEKSSNPTSEEGEHTGRLRVKVVGNGDMAETEERVIGRVRQSIANIADLRAKIMRPVLFSFKTPIELEIHGFDLDALRKISDEATDRLSKVEGLYDVRNSIQPGNPEILIDYDRDQLARYDLGIRQVADLIRGKVFGDVRTRFTRRERKIDIRVKVREEDKSDISDLGRLVINPGEKVPLPLSAVASLRVDEGPNEIRRIDQQRSALITANVAGTDLGSVSAAIDGQMATMNLPNEFDWSVSGQSREMEVSTRSLGFALLLAIFLVYVVMASQFESLIHPLVIIFTIPLGLIGVVGALWLWKTAVSVVVFIGLIMLAGIVVNNAIVLVDYINHLRRSGAPKREAIVQAGSVRLRPILMTTATTVLGLLPMALGLGEGAEIRTPMALTVIAGLISATVLTLVVIPTVYDLMDWRE